MTYSEVIGNVYGLLGFGLSAAVYTQTTDVEGEVNGLMTYDRAVTKYDPATLQALHRRLYEGSPRARVLLADSERTRQMWKYSRAAVAGWTGPDFADANWLEGAAPFQAGSDPLFPTGTQYGDGLICIRKTFRLDKVPANLWENPASNRERSCVSERDEDRGPEPGAPLGPPLPPRGPESVHRAPARGRECGRDGS